VDDEKSATVVEIVGGGGPVLGVRP